MKKLTHWFLMLLAIMLAGNVCAQSNNVQGRTFTMYYAFKSGLSYSIPVKGTVYHSNGEEIKHGKFTAAWKQSVDRYDITGELSYDASCSFADGQLNGPMSIAVSETYRQGSQDLGRRLTLSANYTKGKPSGKWSVTEIGVEDGRRETTTTTVVYKNGEISSIVYGDGTKLSFAPDPDGEERHFVMSGTWEGTLYKNGLDTYAFVNEQGAEIADAELTPLVDSMVAGVFTIDSLLIRGYTLERTTNHVDQLFSTWQSVLGLYAGNYSELALNYYDRNYVLCNSNNGYAYWTSELTEVPLKPAAEIIKWLKQERLAEQSVQNIQSKKKQLMSNRIVKDGTTYYFTHAAKDSLVQYADKALMEKQRVDQLAGQLNKRVQQMTQYQKQCASLEDEVKAFKQLYNDAKGNLRRDTTVLKRALDAASMADSVCVTTIRLVNKGQAVKKKIANDSEANRVFGSVYDKYNLNCQCTNKQHFVDYHKQLLAHEKEVEVFDQVFACREQIKQQHKTLYSTLEESSLAVIGQYKTLYGVQNLSLDKDFNATLVKLAKWAKIQSQYIQLATMYQTIASNTLTIQSRTAKVYSDVGKAYESAMKVTDYTLDSDVEVSIGKAQNVLNMQEACLYFLDERVKITDADNRLESLGKSCKNIYRAYKNYLKEQDLSWSPTTSAAKLTDVEAMQVRFETAMQSPTSMDKDAEIKKMKDKSLETVLDILAK